MTCKPGDNNSPCAKRRAGVIKALSQRDAIEAARQMMLGAAEMVGLKDKERPERDSG